MGEVGEISIDARGHHCPVPTLRLARALKSAVRVRLLADDPMARIDVPHFVSAGRHVLVSMADTGTWMEFVVESGPAVTDATAAGDGS